MSNLNYKTSLNRLLFTRQILQNDSIKNSLNDNINLIKRLKVSFTCNDHQGLGLFIQGCVNSVKWNKTGNLILSGSDDCKLILTNYYEKTTFSTLNTNHTNNIFSFDFLSDSKFISGGLDCIINTNVLENNTINSFNCHSDVVYNLVACLENENIFYSCSQGFILLN